MKKLLVTLAVLGFSTAAMAQVAATFAGVDTDANGEVSLVEAQVAWPDLTQEAYTVADTDQTGSLSQVEFDAYVATLPAA